MADVGGPEDEKSHTLLIACGVTLITILLALAVMMRRRKTKLTDDDGIKLNTIVNGNAPRCAWPDT